jgi:hypothetical protein
MFGFLKKGSKHSRRSTGSSIVDENGDITNTKDEQHSMVSYQEEEAHEDIISSHEPAVSFNAHGSHSFLGPEHDQDEEPTQFSNHSINHKPTTATLGETFSSGGVEEMLDLAESRDESIEVQDSEYFYSEHPRTEFDDDGQFQHENGYTEFIQGTQEEEDADTLDYTATVHPQDDLHIPYNNSNSLAARHERFDEYGEEYIEDGIEAQWEEETLGFETCERTLNTNLEGMHYVPDSSDVRGEPVSSFGLNGRPTGLSHHTEYSNEEEPQYYYEQDEYDQHQESYGAEGYYYDDEGQLMGKSYQEGEGPGYYDANDDFNTIANSTIATEGFDPQMDQPIISTSFLPPTQSEDDESAPIDSYESEDTGSSWGDEETRDMSLLDEGDTVVEGEDDDASGSDSDSESDSDDELHTKSRRRRHRSPKKSMMDLLSEMKELALNGGADSSDDDDEEEEDDMPGVAQISTGPSGSSYESDAKGNRGKKQKKPRGKKKNRNLDNLFEKVSALGHELLGDEPVSNKRKGRRSMRRKEQDPAARIVDGLRDIFNCGHPKHY